MIRIPNWRRFQHYKDRNPPWIKLYRWILTDRHIAEISDRSFRVLIIAWVLASDNDGLVEEADLVFNTRLDSNVLAECLQELVSHKLIEVCDPLLADCKQDASKELDRGEERRGEKRREEPPKFSTFPTDVGPVAVDESTGRLKRRLP